MFIRKKKNKSGSISVQIIDTSKKPNRLLKTIGATKDKNRLKELLKEAHQYLQTYTRQTEIKFDNNTDKQFLKNLKSGLESIQMIGAELVLGKLYDEIGFNQIEEELFRSLVISRLVFPLSKLKTAEYLLRYQNVIIEVDKIYRYLDKLESKQKRLVEQISYNHTLKLFGGKLSIVFYDVTTIYFETSDEDDLRKTGFSKEGKHQSPQIILGLLISVGGYPLAFEIFEGNKFEGHTIMPVVDAFKSKYNLEKLIIIADAAMLSKKNITELIEKDYEFILGGRVKSESDKIKNKILLHRFNDGQSILIKRDDNTRIIVGYSLSRAKKDAHNRKKGLKKLEKLIQNQRLTKKHINNRGYNKYLRLEGNLKVTIDYEKFNTDSCWDGLKGYITNSQLKKEEVIEHYKHLWQIEKAFRISKTDLKVRPVYHRLPKRISAHLIIAFCAYKLYKELERQLKERGSDVSPTKAIELMKTIYSFKIRLPESLEEQNIIFLNQQEQKQLLTLFNLEHFLD
jgi:transposase